MRLRSVAFGNLRRRSSRSAFLVAGLLIGIATVVTLLTLSSALTVQAQNQLETYGANIIVAPRTDDLSLSYGGVALGGVRLQARDMREADLARIKSIPNRKNIAIVAPELLGAVRCRAGRRCCSACAPGRSSASSGGGRSTGGRRRPATSSSPALRRPAARPRDRRPGVSRRPRLHRDRRAAADRVAGRRPADHRPRRGADVLGKPGRVTLVQVAALCSDCPVEEIAAQLGEVLPGTKVTAMQQVQEPHARHGRVPHLQLRRRRRDHRHRGPRRLRDHDGLGQCAHARDRHLPRPRVPAHARHAASSSSRPESPAHSPACWATSPAWGSATRCCRSSPRASA